MALLLQLEVVLVHIWIVTYANNGLGTNQLDELVLDRALGVTLSIGLDVA